MVKELVLSWTREDRGKNCRVEGRRGMYEQELGELEILFAGTRLERPYSIHKEGETQSPVNLKIDRRR